MARFWEIDALRGVAIIMMIIFHFLWNLKYFGYVNFDIYSGFWGIFQVATAGLFLLLAGVVVTISAENHAKNYKKHFILRGGFIFACGLLVSAATYIIFPQEFVYFGILHLIGVSIILSIPIAKLTGKKILIPLVLALIVIILPRIINLQSLGLNYLVWVGLSTPYQSIDFEPIFPWFGAFLIGIFLGNLLYSKGKRAFSLKENTSFVSKSLGPKSLWYKSFVSKKLQFLGRHSLIIYLLHQVVLFGAVYLFSLL